MLVYLKASFAVLFLASVILLSSFFLRSDSDLNNNSQDSNTVISGNEILNSKKVAYQNSSYRENLIQNIQKSNQNTGNEKKVQQEANSLYLAMRNLKREIPEKANSTYKNSVQATKQNPEWMLEALLQNSGTELFSSSGGGNALYTDNHSFLNFDLPDSYIGEDKQNENINNQKYAKEKLYINILATVLLKYQYDNNTPDAVEKFNSWFLDKNPEGKKQVIKEAKDYIKIAEILNNAGVVPDTFKGIHSRMARAYKKAGEKMLLLGEDMNDEEKLQVLESYTKAANDITKAYIAVSDMIDILGISFDEDEPGKLFVFPGSKTPWNETQI